MEGFDIVMLARAPWAVSTSIAEHTVNVLAKRNNRILVVEPLTALSTRFREASLQKRELTLRHGLRQLQDRVWLYTPPPLGLPGHTRWKSATDFNSLVCAPLVRRMMQKLGFASPVIWSYGYNSGKLIPRLGGRLSLYDCGENYEVLARDEAHRRLVRKYEIETCRSCDLVFACSELLGQTRREYNPSTYEVYCAADLEFFGRAMQEQTPVPNDIARLPRPIIGYQGGCDPMRINVGLVQQVARARPEWTLAFVGYLWFGFNSGPFKELPNVHFLGSRPYDDFPGYLKGMDVCMAPFNDNDLVRFGDMLKIYEYLASGRPVVSTSNPAARRVGSAVRIADDAEGFIRGIDAALADDSHSLRTRLSIVADHSWEKRVDQKWLHIEHHLRLRGKSAT